MSDVRASEQSNLFSDEWLLEDFEAVWRSGKTPSVTDFVRRGIDAGFTEKQLLAELIRIDLEYRWRTKDRERWTIEVYQEQHPGLLLTVDLIADELQLRRRNGETLSADQLRNRFSKTSFVDDQEYESWIDMIPSLCLPDIAADQRREQDQAEETLVPATHETRQFGSESRVSVNSTETEMWSALTPRFTKESLLGEGSFGTVWRSFDQQLQRWVAIKTLRPSVASGGQHRDLLIKEARAAAKLNHADLIAIHDVIVDEHHVHLVMAWVDGVPLDQWWEGIIGGADISRRQVIQKFAAMLARIARAIHHAHVAGLIHCDLKPANILVDRQQEPTVLDFGLAVVREGQDSLPRMLVGTPMYMSPEQTWGDTHYLDGRADIWALGVIMYRLLTGAMPFHGKSNQRLFDSIQMRPPVPLGQLRDDIPASLAAICDQCLSKRIEDRYATAALLAADLEQIASQQQSSEAAIATGVLGTVIGIPWTESDLVGRDNCIAAVMAEFDDPRKRLVTLTGVGGIGKTQAAAAIARKLAQRRQEEVVWVDLSTVTDAEQLPSAIFAALGVTQQPHEQSGDRVSKMLAVRGPLLLVLDNLEQIAPASAAYLSSWLCQVETVRFLVTSQVPLRVVGETVHLLSPLAGQENEDAIELFVRRASATQPTFALTAAMRRDVMEICRLVDGNPLAIELAAARIGLLGAAKLRQRLQASFAILSNSRTDRPDRHRTLYNVVRWSYDLLSEPQRQAFLALAIWPAPLPLEIAQTLLEPSSLSGLDVIEELMQRNLLKVQDAAGEMMIQCPTTSTRFAIETIDNSHRNQCVVRFIDILMAREEEIHQSSAALAGAHLADNLWSVVEYLQSQPDSTADEDCQRRIVFAVLIADRIAEDHWDSAIRIKRLNRCVPPQDTVERLEWLLRLADATHRAGENEEAERLAQEAMETADTFVDSTGPIQTCPQRLIQIAVTSRRLLGTIRFRKGSADQAITLLESALSKLAGSDDSSARFDVLMELAEIQRRMGHLQLAENLLRKSKSLIPNPEPPAWADATEQPTTSDTIADVNIARWMTERGKLSLQQGHIGDARALFDKAISRLSTNEDSRDLQQAILGRAAAAAEVGDFAAASRDYEKCEALSRRLGDLPTLAKAINNHALAYDDAGDSAQCCLTLDRALELYQHLGDSVGAAICLSAMAAARLQLGFADEALAILNSPQVCSFLPPDSIHQAIVLGDQGVAQANLGELRAAKLSLVRCLAILDQLGIADSAERLLYTLELTEVLRQLDDPNAHETRHQAAVMVSHWPVQNRCRTRLKIAIDKFKKQWHC